MMTELFDSPTRAPAPLLDDGAGGAFWAPVTAAVFVVCGGLVVAAVTMDPISVAGIAVPTPVPVHCGGIESVAVFGFAAGSEA